MFSYYKMDKLKSYCNTGDISKLRLVTYPIKEILLESAPYALRKYKNNKGLYWHRAAEILDILSEPDYHGENCENLKGLKWVGNSCYLDSSLFSLFAVPTTFVDDNIINAILLPRNRPLVCATNGSSQVDLENRRTVQKQLRTIVKHIRGGGEGVKYCTDLRRALRKCPNAENYYDNNMKDAGEFLTYILEMFDTDVAVKETITYYTNNVTDVMPSVQDLVKSDNVNIDRRASIIQFVDSFRLSTYSNNKDHNIRQFLSDIIDSGEFDDANKPYYRGLRYNRRISITNLISTPYLIFRFQRLHPITEGILQTRIIPSQTLTLDVDARFILSAIIVFQAQHYTSYFRCGNDWYFYNDVDYNEPIKIIGTYQNLLKSRPSPISGGTLYFYTPISS